MAVLQYQYGDTNPVAAPFDSAETLAVGDIVGIDTSGYIYPAADETWDTNIGTTQTNFHPKFAGIVTQKKRSTDTKPYGNSAAVARVATSGVFEADCASATFKVGDYIGPAKASGNALESQKVVGVATVALAIGVCVEAGASITRVKFRLLSAKTPLAPSA